MVELFAASGFVPRSPSLVIGPVPPVTRTGAPHASRVVRPLTGTLTRFAPQRRLWCRTPAGRITGSPPSPALDHRGLSPFGYSVCLGRPRSLKGANAIG